MGEGDLRAAIRERHQPRLPRLFRPVDASDAGSQSEAFECFLNPPNHQWSARYGLSNFGCCILLTMEGNCNQKYHELAADRDAKGHANENTVEEDTNFEENTL